MDDESTSHVLTWNCNINSPRNNRSVSTQFVFPAFFSRLTGAEMVRYSPPYDSGQSMLPSLMSSMMSWGARPEIEKKVFQHLGQTNTSSCKSSILKERQTICPKHRIPSGFGDTRHVSPGGSSGANYFITTLA